MAKASAWGKAQRVLKFLLGLSNPRIAATMVDYGFSEADLDEGWTLLRALRPVRLDVVPPPAPESAPLDRLLAWERDWIPIARPALRRHFPKLHQRLFAKGASEGLAKVIFVSEFLRTMDGLERTAEGKKARALLEQRRLTRAVLADGRARLEALQRLPTTPSSDPSGDRSDWLAHETKLWAWYLDWGAIASSKIKDRNLLRQLGFLAPARSARSAVEQVEPLDDEEAPPA